MVTKPQRIRDPVHDLIEFSADSEFEQILWEIVNTPQFQRLRRIKQLGFSELVFPGATHTRFAHSLGVFHTARQLGEVIKRETGELDEEKLQVALTAALVHDIGHGPFSHAFERATKASRHTRSHEDWTAEILTGKTEINKVIVKFGPGFDEKTDRDQRRLDLLNILKNKAYDSIVLELAATVLFLQKCGYDTPEDAWQETKLRKATKATPQRVKTAEKLLGEISEFIKDA